ncbi:Omp28-related outer membrane protein [Winogradskyella eckloniae]|uniref:T9SS type A sorting domain-containing protein n=1 Tax=Winogradskyella eckloniae TaxID=1089306 RepID=UPI001567C48D|nr:Omp28-related outer membrane protein [Winogradskyella eckloniae]NRD20858.1 Omp28-related outer membrane protein [Winogradskyella eckloniae]
MIKKITHLFLLCFTVTQLATAQTFFADDFSDYDISDWTNYDSDGDTYVWSVMDWSAYIADFDATLVSRSWTSATGGLSPNNYIVSSAIDLTNAAATGLQLAYAYGTIEGAPYHAEQYSIYITTANDLATIQAATPIHNETLTMPSSRQTNAIDISSFAGQIVYLTFRHHDTFDMNSMMIDDIKISIPVDRDAKIEAVNLNRFSVLSTDNQLSLDIKNNGSIAISSLDINWNDGTTDHISTISTNIAPGETVTINHPMMVNYATVEEKDIDITISMVNGSNDENPTDNVADAKFNTVSQPGTKRILIEEATGTWCGFCPNGAVGMDYMTSTYPNTVIGIAVHNSDPMALPAYDAGINPYIGGYPSGVTDRKLEVYPSQASLQNDYNTRINEITPVDVSTSATQTGNDLVITANASFYTNFSNTEYRFGVIISEDGVTGTASGYAQVNYYSGDPSAPGNYGNLPDPVPASQMVYDHVGIALLGGFSGEAGSVPAVINDGDSASYTFNYTIPASSNQDNLHINVVLINQTDGTVLGAYQSTVAQALSVQEVSGIDSIKLYPNPATDKLNIGIEAGNGNYNITVTDMLGRRVINTAFEGVFGNQNIELPVSQLNAGHYMLTINNGINSYSSKFIVSK